MFTIKSTIKIAIAVFATGILTNVSAVDPRKPLDRREREQREARERREAERGGWDAEDWGTSRWEAQERRGAHHEPGPDEMIRELEARMDHLHEKIHDRRMQQVEVEAKLQRAQIDNRGERVVHELQRQLVEIQRELQQLELELVQHQRMLETGVERHELMRMTDRIEYVSNWHDVAFSAPHAVMMATQALVEMFVGGEESDPEHAVRVLEKLLERIDELGSRTAIRFALKDVYMHAGKPEKAAEHMMLIIQENARRLDGIFDEALPRDTSESSR